MVTIHLSKGSWLEVETVPVEAGVWGARLEGVVKGFGDIPHSKEVDILQCDGWQGRRCRHGRGSCVRAAGLGWGDQLAGIVPDTEQLGMDTIPQLLGSPPLCFTAREY